MHFEPTIADHLHAGGWHFFRVAEEARLPASAAIKGKDLAEMQKLYRPDHPLRQGLFALDSIEEIRLFKGKP